MSNHQLKQILATQRAVVAGRTFAQMPEAFKDIEATKLAIHRAGMRVPVALSR